MKSLPIFVTLLALFTLGQARVDPLVWAQFTKEVSIGTNEVTNGEEKLREDIKLHPEMRFQHKTYCGQLITMINNVGIKIDSFDKQYAGLMDAGQASGWARLSSANAQILTDLTELNKTI